MRVILLGFLLHWRDQLPVGGMSVYSQMVKKHVSAIQSIEHFFFFLNFPVFLQV